MEWATTMLGLGVAPTWASAWSLFAPVLSIWLLGTLTGYLLPRPKSLFSFLLTGTGLRNFVLAFHGFFIAREVWYKITDPGTFRRFCKAVLLWACFQGWHFDFPSSDEPSGAPKGAQANVSTHNGASSDSDNWYVTEKDLAFFIYHGEGTGATQGAGPWELMMDKEIDQRMKYKAWRRVLPTGSTEYKSCTITADSTAEEYLDLYLDDNFRTQWDGMIREHSVAEHGNFAQRQQVVRWTRHLPFINSRQYTIGRRSFQRGADLYGITKGVEHPSAAGDAGLVSVEEFHSMWRSRTVECPWGSGKPACETLLLHHENLKVPENLARFAVKHGMWGVVKKMAAEHPKFIAARRARGVPADQSDPGAYGAGFAPNPPSIARSLESCASLCSMGSSMSDSSSDVDAPARSSSRARKLRGFAAFAIASSLAVLVGRKGTGEGKARAGGMSRSTSMASGMCSAASRTSRSQRHRFSGSLEPMTE